MKVFAHYFKLEENGNDYRWRTLLQFGSSWDVIGSVVMKNPGSAAPLYSIEDKYILEHLNQFSSDHEWFAFSPDNTMVNIEKLFRTYYHNQSGNYNLNGIIQIFNLMNVRDPNLETALIKNRQATFPMSKTTRQDIKQLISPVYLGWGNLGFNTIFREGAEQIYSVVQHQKNGKYLFPKFEITNFIILNG